MTDDDVARWFGVAEANLEAAEVLSASGHAAPGAFYAQQTAEAALKALVLARRGASAVDWLGQHELEQLVEQVRQSGLAIPADLEVATRRLSAHYHAARYPSSGSTTLPQQAYDAPTAAQALEDARMVVEFARAYLAL